MSTLNGSPLPGFMATMKKVFDLKPGQNIQGFMAECRELDQGERKWFHKHLCLAGYECEAPLEATK